jgi:hypothetical protein
MDLDKDITQFRYHARRDFRLIAAAFVISAVIHQHQTEHRACEAAKRRGINPEET